LTQKAQKKAHKENADALRRKRSLLKKLRKTFDYWLQCEDISQAKKG
jgi:hypothetical protein